MDPACVGTWTLGVRNEAGAWTLSWSIHADGTYGSSAKGPAPLPEETGTMQARSGKWAVKASGGRSDGGTYEPADKDTLVATGKVGGPARWKRAVPVRLDSALPGTWLLDLKNDQGSWTFTFNVRTDGTYRTSVRGTSPLPEEMGSISAADGKWLLAASSGRRDSGTYQLPDKETLLFETQLGPARWRRPKAAAPLSAPAGPLKAPPEDALVSPVQPVAGLVDYLDGLDEIESRNWEKALAAFDRSILSQPNVAAPRYGRLAVHVFTERFHDFFRELEPAIKLSGTHDDPELGGLMAFGCELGRNRDKVFWCAPDWPGSAYFRYLSGLAAAYPSNPARTRASFEGIATRFVESRLRDDKIALGLLGRGFERQKKSDFAGAWRDYDRVIERFPYNWTAMGKRAECFLEMGRPEPARRSFTQLLSARTDVTEAYLGRALAAARQGDPARMKQDLAIAEQLSAAKTAEFRRLHAADLDGMRAATEDPQALYDDLLKAARAP